MSTNIKSIYSSFRNSKKSRPLVSLSGLLHIKYKYILYSQTMYIYCVHSDIAKSLKTPSKLSTKEQNQPSF